MNCHYCEINKKKHHNGSFFKQSLKGFNKSMHKILNLKSDIIINYV